VLKINYLPIETKRVFELMAEIRQLSAFTLIGGTALALQIGHRLSEDLDFWVGDSELNKRNISETLHLLAQKGCNVKLTTPSQNIIFEKNLSNINGTQQSFSFAGWFASAVSSLKDFQIPIHHSP